MKFGVRIPTEVLSLSLVGDLPAGEWCFVCTILWFDVQNNSELTAGGVELTVHSDNPEVATFLSEQYNFGYVAQDELQIQYSKINGTGIVSRLRSDLPTFHVPTGPSYFLTNPFFDGRPTTAVWVRLTKGLKSGTKGNFKVTVNPGNGVGATMDFPYVTQ